MLKNIEYIDSEKQFEVFLDKAAKARQIAVDLEFDSNHHHYGFSLCLMQIFCGEKAYLIDPQFVDISKVFSLFENENVEKIVFSFGEDLRLLASMGCKTRNIYDISTAVKLLDYEKISLADVIRENLEIELEKGSQTSDWCRRPISEKQLLYAANDVFYLPELKKIIDKKIRENGIEKWLEEENKAMENIDYSANLRNAIKEKDKRNMTEFQWYFYQKLWEFREQIAEKADKPPHRVIDNNLLKELAINPSLLNNWKNNKGIIYLLKNDFYASTLKKLYKSALKEAKNSGLSMTEMAMKYPSKEAAAEKRAKRHENEKIKEEIFKPVREAIKRDYGENAVNFILSNRLIDEILRGEKQNLRNYKKELLLKYGDAEYLGKWL